MLSERVSDQGGSVGLASNSWFQLSYNLRVLRLAPNQALLSALSLLKIHSFPLSLPLPRSCTHSCSLSLSQISNKKSSKKIKIKLK